MFETTSTIIARLARAHESGVSEATIQSDVRQLILSSNLNLIDDNVEEVNLESPTGDGTRRRIDIEVATTVIEVKRDLHAGKVLVDAEAQLAGYVHRRVRETGTRFYGILTDGRHWRLYIPEVGDHRGIVLVGDELVISSAADETKLLDWLGAILSRVEGIYPTPERIEQVLGASSPSYKADHATLLALFESAVEDPEVQLKRELWDKLLRTAFGEDFDGDIQLFVDHTLLVLTAEIIAHAVIGYDVSRSGSLTADQLAQGTLFTQAEINGVVEADFFDWPLEVDGGHEFITTLANRLARFDWKHVDHDVLKHVYESIVTPETRQNLGEYYTPDWLAEHMLDELGYDPLENRVLDASCGSGTFIFHAVRDYLEAADEAGIDNREAINGVVSHVFGMDIHPVAVALARVTYLLAIGTERLQKPRDGFSVPVYIGDSVQWEQSKNLFAAADTVTIPTSGSSILSADEALISEDPLRIPVSLMRDTQRFDEIINSIAAAVVSFESSDQRSRHDNLSKLEGTFAKDLNKSLQANFPELSKDELETMTQTGTRMFGLELMGRDRIWAYYVRNLIRPVWLSMPDNRVDILVGNPPWLRYNKMNAWMQKKFLDHSRDHNLIIGRLGASGRDLATLFVARACELYLRSGGRFSFVMPHSALTRKSSAGFRTGNWALHVGEDRPHEYAQFDEVWDLQNVSTGFPITSGVIVGRTSPDKANKMPMKAKAFSGRLNPPSQPWDKARDSITTKNVRLEQVTSDDLPKSPYARRFRQGAILVPRRLMWAVEQEAGPLGVAAGKVMLRSRVARLDKAPWKSLAPISAAVGAEYVFDGVLGEHLMPYDSLPTERVVLPIRDDSLIPRDDAFRDPNIEPWWRTAEAHWDANKKPGTEETLAEHVDFLGQLSAQLGSSGGYLVLYPKSGNNIAASWIRNSARTMIDHQAYWMQTDSLLEARYLTGILNSQTLVERVRPFQAVGLFGARHFDKYVFSVPFDLFDHENDDHAQLVDLVSRAEEVASLTDVSGGKTFQAKRKLIRKALQKDGIAEKIEAVVNRILPELTLDDDVED
ncbi:Eco57I restriction-modification methylase domain-containing protein [Brevibacterium sp. HMSC063G07]|uniref:Eco57I restriction-modification methylase domain-containing protein n=1 Tax=Brevibacterium sp. HMSC063G07 TaxID=1739261 RepID=UPI0008C458A4|nr:N-6 DNA methylase [Brevibacterium sp. HMSC063G07]OFL64110.1 hypothetical protein HMPREF2757_01215 [Brevibacterium sp. HMSC063G07]